MKEFITLFLHLASNLLSVYYVPSTSLGIEETEMNKTGEGSSLLEFIIQSEKAYKELLINQ